MTLSGPDRAAIILLTLGEEHAAAIMKHMGPERAQTVGLAMANMTGVGVAQATDVLNGFLDELKEKTAIGLGNEEYIRSVLKQSLGEEQASIIAELILSKEQWSGIVALRNKEAPFIAQMLSSEHPQIIATVISHLESEHAAAVLEHLPEDRRTDVIMRVARLAKVSPSALTELDAILDLESLGSQNLVMAQVGGVKAVASIMNHLSSEVEHELSEKIRSTDEELSNQIGDAMFSFDDLAETDNRYMQVILREVTSDMLLTALKGAEESTKTRFLSNMSKRAAAMFEDDLEAKGPVRLSEVEQAQKEIIGIARRLQDEGQITLGTSGDEFV
jgi:flagellar motor switch protein FliG